jgi:hypothetical protein
MGRRVQSSAIMLTDRRARRKNEKARVEGLSLGGDPLRGPWWARRGVTVTAPVFYSISSGSIPGRSTPEPKKA